MRAILVHGWGGSPQADWFPWATNQLRKDGYEVLVPEMPNTDEPRIEEWVSHLEAIAENYDENTLFIGHSIGCQTIMRFLAKQNKKAKAAIFVAGWFDLPNLETFEEKAIADPWLREEIDFNKFRQNIQSFVSILSVDDPDVPFGITKKKFEDLGATIVVVAAAGHFTESDGYGPFPILIEQIESLK